MSVAANLLLLEGGLYSGKQAARSLPIQGPDAKTGRNLRLRCALRHKKAGIIVTSV